MTVAIFKVTCSLTFPVQANTAAEAQRVASMYFRQEAEQGTRVDAVYVEKISILRGIPPGWAREIPWGNAKNQSIREILSDRGASPGNEGSGK